MAEQMVLLGGPQDGSSVRRNGDKAKLPDVVYVGPKWQGDGLAAWGSKKSKRFPVAYQRDGNVYRYAHGQHYLAAVYYRMQQVRLRTKDSVEMNLRLYADGSGEILYDGTMRGFSNLETAANLMRQVDEAGYLS